jgi:hypothetical protein
VHSLSHMSILSLKPCAQAVVSSFALARNSLLTRRQGNRNGGGNGAGGNNNNNNGGNSASELVSSATG